MKSVFLSILIFIAVALFAGSDVLAVIGNDWFHYFSYISFAVIMLCAVLITMFYTPKKSLAKDITTPEEKVAKTKETGQKKDENNDE